jgi:methionine-S-sulfoxide reductase
MAEQRDDAPETAEAVLAGGCFWCLEGALQQLPGVQEVVSGYAGGRPETADYETVCTGRTGHAEAVRVRHDPGRLSYERLLDAFFAAHDPTQKNRQGPDVGPQYRSAVFYADEAQRATAEAKLGALAPTHEAPIQTTLEPLEGFYPAEAHHQDFVRSNPRHPYVQMHAKPVMERVRKVLGD